MRKLFLLVLIVINLHSYEVGVNFGVLSENVYGVSLEQPLTPKYSVQVSYDREEDRLMYVDRLSKAIRCGSSKPQPEPSKPVEEVKLEPPSETSNVLTQSVIKENVDRYEVKVLYTVTNYDAFFVDVFVGLGYTDSDIYDDNTYIPVGARLGAMTKRYNLYFGYKLIADMDINKDEDMFFIGAGYKF